MLVCAVIMLSFEWSYHVKMVAEYRNIFKLKYISSLSSASIKCEML